MIELRISDYRWNDLHTEAQSKIKELARDWGSNWGYDHEFGYYWIRFTEENYMLAKIKDFDQQHLLKVSSC